MAEDPVMEDPTRSTVDRGELRARLGAWFSATIPDSRPEIGEVTSPSGSGMSSETLLFDATWTEDGERRSAPLVARLAPHADDVPVFRHYDLALQFDVMHLVRERSSVPVPETVRYEPDPSHLGEHFFVMGRVEGRVPADIPPYAMEGWLLDADPADQRALQDASVGLLAELHSIDIATQDVGFLETGADGDTPLRRHFADQRSFYQWVARERDHPVLDAAFEWLDDNWPTDEGPTVVCWGDARIGNVMYDGFTPVGVFDWEMATLGPRGLDLGWMVFMHRFFQDICETLELPGMPDFLRPADAAATYEAGSGHRATDLGWYMVYAALRHGIIMSRITDRMVHFGQAEWSEDPDAAIPHRGWLADQIGHG